MSNDNNQCNGHYDGEANAEGASPVNTARLFPSCRMTVTLMMFAGCMVTYVLRLNMGFAMVCMIKPPRPILETDAQDAFIGLSTMTETNQTSNVTATVWPAVRRMGVLEADQGLPSSPALNDVCSPGYSKRKRAGPDDKKPTGEFEWQKSLQGALLGAFFYGYIVTQVPAGWLCDRIGGKLVLGTGLGVVSALTLLIPESARIDPYAMLAVRVFQGMFAAVSFPAIHSLVGNWAPPTERGVLMSISYSGMYVGTLLTFPLCGLLCDYGFAGGWPSIFYVTGTLGLVYVIFLCFLVYDGYEKHPRISSVERTYLQKTLVGHQETGTHKVIPWSSFLKSKPVWAIIIAHLCANWGLYTLVINLPLFMKEVLKFDIKQNGLLSSLPYLCTLFVNLFCGKLTDYLRRNNIMGITTLRKTFNSIGMFIPALCMFSITLLYCEQRYVAVGALTACQAISGFAYSGGFFYNHVDLSPQHAGILMGISNMFATIPGILSPLLVGILTPNGTREEWLIIFYIGTVTYSVGAIVYLLLGSGEQQPWSLSSDPEKEDGISNVEMKSLNHAEED